MLLRYTGTRFLCDIVRHVSSSFRDHNQRCSYILLGMRALSLAVGEINLEDSYYSATIEEFQGSIDPDPDEDGFLRRGGKLVIKFL